MTHYRSYILQFHEQASRSSEGCEILRETQQLDMRRFSNELGGFMRNPFRFFKFNLAGSSVNPKRFPQQFMGWKPLKDFKRTITEPYDEGLFENLQYRVLCLTFHGFSPGDKP